MIMFTYLMVFVIAFAGAFVQGITGFGSAMVWMSFLPLVIALPEASALTPAMLTIIGIQMTIKLHKNINWKMSVVPLVVSFISTAIGAWIMTFTTATTMQLVLGVFLVIVGIYFFATMKKTIKIKPTYANGGIAGFVAGVFTGLLNIGGPPLAIYYNAAADSPLQYKACIEFNFFMMYGWATILKFMSGSYTTETVKYLIPGAVAVIISGIAGLHLFKKFNKKIVSILVYTMLIIMGAYQFCKGMKLF